MAAAPDQNLHYFGMLIASTLAHLPSLEECSRPNPAIVGQLLNDVRLIECGCEMLK